MFKQMIIKQFAEQFKEQLIKAQKENDTQLRYTVEVFPVLNYDDQTESYSESKETVLCLYTPKGCVSEGSFSDMIEDAENSDSSEVAQVFELLKSFEIGSISEWLTNYMETERKKHKADIYLFMMFLKDTVKKNPLTKKVRTKTVGIFQMLVQQNNQFRAIEEFTV